ncbi:hypothetical protein R3W88_029704 [Solanum pinnatisectum]|uniref:Uncharacterized protein n=1 Tax=Solanum pinnatisectum TaxID=50273 RepID=A0AAV9K638_9SOLN|nr:hypothetical protein R3W88_029704 [Solanum pinnatisectum]
MDDLILASSSQFPPLSIKPNSLQIHNTSNLKSLTTPKNKFIDIIRDSGLKDKEIKDSMKVEPILIKKANIVGGGRVVAGVSFEVDSSTKRKRNSHNKVPSIEVAQHNVHITARHIFLRDSKQSGVKEGEITEDEKSRWEEK